MYYYNSYIPKYVLLRAESASDHKNCTNVPMTNIAKLVCIQRHSMESRRVLSSPGQHVPTPPTLGGQRFSRGNKLCPG